MTPIGMQGGRKRNKSPCLVANLVSFAPETDAETRVWLALLRAYDRGHITARWAKAKYTLGR